MLVNSKILRRLGKCTCSPEPLLITSVISTSRLVTKDPGTSSYVALCKFISYSYLSCTSIEVPSMSHTAWVFLIQQDMTQKQSITVHSKDKQGSVNVFDLAFTEYL